MNETVNRCPWAKTDLYIEYHDQEWGVPVHDDRLLFEFLILEGAQTGLSWETILKKRDNYREAFDQFDPAIVAKYGQKKRQSLLSNPGIVRNKLKIEAAIQNAKAFLAVQKEFGSFDKYIWAFVGQEPGQNARKSDEGRACHDPRVGRHEQGLEAAGLQIRGQHDLLRLHAGGGHGQRSPCRMLQA
jgi:DNA-3-methyladenine glycosylase I